MTKGHSVFIAIRRGPDDNGHVSDWPDFSSIAYYQYDLKRHLADAEKQSPHLDARYPVSRIMRATLIVHDEEADGDD